MTAIYQYSNEAIEAHGLTPAEYERIVELLGREPSFAELGIFSVMWSEHCSYKHSKNTLRKLPTTGLRVVQGPGENAGALDIGGGYAVVFKVESHNHPSAVEPYQGAATGVGGILRDIHTMGGRPVANLNSLSFGVGRGPEAGDMTNGTDGTNRTVLEQEQEQDKEQDQLRGRVGRAANNGVWFDDLIKFRIGGVISGIADYGNCTGIPTVGGEINFDPSYYGNPLVNAMCAGIVETKKIARCAAGKSGAKLLYYGSATGRDGIHGATFASVELDEGSDARRPCVQVADPFMGKKIMEATLDLINSGVVDGIQDMGAAGLTCSSTEMAHKGGMGLRMNLDLVPQRTAKMSAYEILLSESQERMLAAVAPENVERAFEILRKWDVEGAIIGEIVEGGQMIVTHQGRVEVDFELDAVIGSCPVYEPEMRRPAYLDEVVHVDLMDSMDGMDKMNGPDGKDRVSIEQALRGLTVEATLMKVLALPQIASKRWIYRQFDHSVQANTLLSPGGDAAAIRVRENGCRLAFTLDSNPLFCYLDPHEGGKHVVAEAARNVAATGALPIGFTNCLNFGNPDKPEIFYQFAQCVEGMAEAGRALETPVVSGNVSLYNETAGFAIPPTPVVGMVGWIEPGRNPLPAAFQRAGDAIVLIGDFPEHLGGSTLLHDALEPTAGRHYGPVQQLDLDLEQRKIDCLIECARAGLLRSAHDVSAGGLLTALAECCVIGTQRIGAVVDSGAVGMGGMDKMDGMGGMDSGAASCKIFSALFGEGAGQFVLTCATEDAAAVVEKFKAAKILAQQIGVTGGESLHCGKWCAISLAELGEIYFREPFRKI